MNSNKDKTKFSIVYQITNLLTGKIYVGCHVTYNINDKYMGSSKHLKKDIKLLGRENFKKDVLFVYDNQKDMMNKEAEIVNKEFCLRSDTYNLMVGGIHEFTWFGTVVVKDQAGNRSRVYEEDPRFLSGELVGINKGYSQTEETKEKIRNSNMGHISSNKGKPISKEQKKKMSIAAQNRPSNRTGKTISLESKERISKGQKERWAKLKAMS